MTAKFPVPLALAITELEPGGAEQCLVRLATGLDRTRFAPSVYSLAPRPQPPRDGLVRALEAAHIPVHFVGVTRWWQAPRALRRLTGTLRAQRPQILQTFLFHANVLGAWAAARAGVPHVLAGLRVAEPRGWRWRLERRALRQVNRYVCVSEQVANKAREHHFAAEKLVTIPNGVDLAALAAAEPAKVESLGLPPGTRVLLSVGRLCWQKGFDFLISASPRLFVELPQHHLVIAGEGPERPRLERLCRELRVADRVHLVGYRSDVPALMRAADAFLLTSRYEGFANALAEALAAGLPFVALPSAVCRADLGPLHVRQVVASRDPSKFVDLVVSFARQGEMGRELGRENREWATANLSLNSMLSAYQNLWQSVLNEAR